MSGLHPIVNQSSIEALLKRDEIFYRIRMEYGDPPKWQRTEGFETLSQIILEQQIHLNAARAHFRKLKKEVDPFTPANLLKLTDEEMRACQVSRQKASYLRNLSHAIYSDNLRLDKFHELSESEIRKELTRIKGIGNWTADVYLIFCLSARDILPLGDVAVRHAISELSDLQSVDEMQSYSLKWQPYRSLATFFLWHYYLNKRGRAFTLDYIRDQLNL